MSKAEEARLFRDLLPYQEGGILKVMRDYEEYKKIYGRRGKAITFEEMIKDTRGDNNERKDT